MKIAYVGNFSQRHCTEVHIALTLEDLGHEVVRLQEDRSNTANGLINRIKMAGPIDLFLWTRTFDLMTPEMPEFLEIIKALSIPTASYHLDLYVGLKREDGLDTDAFWQTDYVFTPDGDPTSAEVFKRKDINHYYMKPGVYKGECYISGQNTIINDVLFVGGGEATDAGPQYGHTEWPYRGELIKWLRDNYGDRFTKYGWPQDSVRNEELNVIYSNSKVTVGDSLCLNFNHPYYWSDRVYETIGRGGFIIHPYIKGMKEEFKDGVHLRYYEYGNFKQLKYFIDYYLKHTEEREKIRQAGHKFVKEHATYHNRLTQMLDIVGAK